MHKVRKFMIRNIADFSSHNDSRLCFDVFFCDLVLRLRKTSFKDFLHVRSEFVYMRLLEQCRQPLVPCYYCRFYVVTCQQPQMVICWTTCYDMLFIFDDCWFSKREFLPEFNIAAAADFTGLTPCLVGCWYVLTIVSDITSRFNIEAMAA